MAATPMPKRETFARLIAGYRPVAGAADELLDRDGVLRPAWVPLLQHLAALKPDEAARRFARGDQYLRDAGVFHRQYGASAVAERDWPLSHMPVVIHENEWQPLAEGLVQRAALLEAVAADLYGDNQLVADGHLPASLIAASPEWLRPLIGARPPSGHFLHFLAFEVGRGPDGNWWVLSDRTQAPSGAGFALENRVATTHVFSEFYGDARVHRIAGFFRAFRETLVEQAGGDQSRVAILTPGPHSDTYYEHAYIARYLGLLLLEGEDLTVQNGELMVRTVGGPKPISVLWRRLDAAWADPLELDESSQIGTPGLVGAIRKGSVGMVNALGVGVLETRALLAFLPRICEALLGEPLKIPNIATWWCGQPAELAHVRDNIEAMTIGPALSTRLPLEMDEDTALAGRFVGDRKGKISDWLEREAATLVGQELVTLSTTPAFAGGRLVPRPMSLRVFLARTANGWQVMPGGFARIGASEDPTAIAMRRGAAAADVWIVTDGTAARDTMLPEPSTPFVRSQPTFLPSRAADNLFWLGRYAERAEGIMRLVRAFHARLAESGNGQAPLFAAISRHLTGYGVDPKPGLPEGLVDTLASAVGSAAKIRDRFSIDGWNALSDLARTAQRMGDTVQPGDDAAAAMGVLLRKMAGFTGLVADNMYRFTGWRFLAIGRAVERAGAMAGLLARFCAPGAPEGALDLAIEVGDSVLTHRRRFSVTTTRGSVIDLLALDALNPRSMLYQITEIRDQMAFLPGAEQYGPMSDLARTVLKLHTGLSVQVPEALDAEALLAMRGEIAALSDRISANYFS